MKLQKLTFLLGCLLALLAAVPAAAQDAPPPLTYTVRPGDALPALAARFGTDTATVARLNSLQDPRRIYPGQRLIFPANSHPAYAWRPLAAGETLSSLARRVGMPWEDLARVNTLLNPDTLLVGQSLYLPPLAPAQVTLAVSPEPRLLTALRQGLPYWRVLDLNPRPAYAGDLLTLPTDAPATPALPYPVTALNVSPQPVARGNTVILALTTAVTSSCEVIYLEGVAPCYARDAASWTALVAIPPLATPGRHTVTLQLQTDAGPVVLPVPLQVTRGRYDYERIDLPPSRQSLLDPQLSQNERVKIAQLRTLRTPERLWEYPFRRPIEASVTSYFGSRRSYGAGFTSYHDGTDFQGETGAPVLAPASGVVVLAEPLVVRGNAILIDHGWGVVSGYWHLSRIDVTVGQQVAPGDRIGALGNTGMSTGPHLHWELWVNGNAVSALQWVTNFAPELQQ